MDPRRALLRITPTALLRRFADPYFAGDSEADAVEAARWHWRKRRLKSTIELLGENSASAAEVAQAIEAHLRLIRKLGRQEFATLSLKPTMMGYGPELAGLADAMAQLAEAAAEHGLAVTINKEGHHTTEAAHATFRTLLPRFPDLGMTLQSRLHRTDADIAELSGTPARFRLCIGLFAMPAELALQDRDEMKRRLLVQAERLLGDGHRVEFGTHDPALVAQLLDLLGRLGVGPERVEFQMQMGVPRASLQRRLIRAGYTVRLCVPYGENWAHSLSYARSRLHTDPAMIGFGLRNLIDRMLRRG